MSFQNLLAIFGVVANLFGAIAGALAQLDAGGKLPIKVHLGTRNGKALVLNGTVDEE
jgi:hypothetical protein